MIGTPLMWDFVLLAALLSLAAFFASSETAILSMSNARVKSLMDSKKRNAKLLFEIKSNPQQVLITILIANNLVNVTTATIATVLALELFPENWGIAFSTGLITLVILVFGEITPKSFALRHSEELSLAAAPILKFLSTVLSPVVWFVETITGLLVNILSPSFEKSLVTEEEIKAAASLSAESGAILKEEKELIHRIFLLNDITLEKVMAPRSEIIALKSGTLIKDIPSEVLTEHARFPVYKSNLDDIIGVIYMKDYAKRSIGSGGAVSVDSLMRRPIFARSNKTLDRMLKEFEEKKNHLAIVVGPKGDTLGLVTLEDLTAAIVGRIKSDK